LVDGVVHRALHGDRAVTAVPRGHLLEAHRQQRRHPTTVAAAGPHAGELRLQDPDPQTRVDLLEVVRGPQSCVAGTDDRDVGGDVAGQTRALHEAVVAGKRVDPEGDGARGG